MTANPSPVVLHAPAHAAPAPRNVTLEGTATAASTCSPSASIGLNLSQVNPTSPNSRRSRPMGCSTTFSRETSNDSYRSNSHSRPPGANARRP